MIFSLPQLPSMRCDDGCGECCGPVFISQDEYERIERVVNAQGITPRRNGPLTCPLYIDGKCSVYLARPAICRLFGHAPKLVCSRGYDTPATPRQIEKYKQYMRRSTRGGEDVRLLHELVYSEYELIAEFSVSKETAKS